MERDQRAQDDYNRILPNYRVVLSKKYAGDELYDSRMYTSCFFYLNMNVKYLEEGHSL
jgi:hypothetical protein